MWSEVILSSSGRTDLSIHFQPSWPTTSECFSFTYGDRSLIISILGSFQLLLILIEDILTSISENNNFMIKIEPLTCICMIVFVMNFWAARSSKKFSFWLFRPTLRELGLFHPYFLCKCSFREISMIKMVILDQNKPMLLILKSKIKY